VAALGELPVAKVEERVKLTLEFLHQHGITKEWQDYLPPNDCGLALFGGTRRGCKRQAAQIAQS
jgi:hypothetical protein